MMLGYRCDVAAVGRLSHADEGPNHRCAHSQRREGAARARQDRSPAGFLRGLRCLFFSVHRLRMGVGR